MLSSSFSYRRRKTCPSPHGLAMASGEEAVGDRRIGAGGVLLVDSPCMASGWRSLRARHGLRREEHPSNNGGDSWGAAHGWGALPVRGGTRGGFTEKWSRQRTGHVVVEAARKRRMGWCGERKSCAGRNRWTRKYIGTCWPNKSGYFSSLCFTYVSYISKENKKCGIEL